MNAPLLQVSGVSKHFGGFAALSDVSLSVTASERLGIIGPNGSGKTTLINCIAGALRNDTGRIHFDGTDVTNLAAHHRAQLGLARSFQIPRPFASLTVEQNVAVPLEYLARAKGGERVNPRAQAAAILDRMELGAKAQAQAGTLSQVELRRLELARAIAVGPRLLILDEVMAGLATAEVDALLKIVIDIARSGVAIVMIEHIMRAIMGFSERIICLDAGRIVAEGEPQAVVNNPIVHLIYLGA